jgi:hypothetical protein
LAVLPGTPNLGSVSSPQSMILGLTDQRMTGEQQVVNQADQIPKNHGAKASDDA